MLAFGGFNLVSFFLFVKGLQLVAVVRANIINNGLTTAFSVLAGIVVFAEPATGNWSGNGAASDRDCHDRAQRRLGLRRTPGVRTAENVNGVIGPARFGPRLLRPFAISFRRTIAARPPSRGRFAKRFLFAQINRRALCVALCIMREERERLLLVFVYVCVSWYLVDNRPGGLTVRIIGAILVVVLLLAALPAARRIVCMWPPPVRTPLATERWPTPTARSKRGPTWRRRATTVYVKAERIARR